MLYEFFTPILGGVIGYFTNWLAIKMLFLPREPKYIGKLKIPFTPGLIPKERERLSHKIATVCEKNILNNETIKENVFTEENKEKVYLLIEKNYNDLIQKDYNLSHILEKINQNDFLDKLQYKGHYYIEEYLKNEKNQQFLADFITQKIVHFIKNIQDYDFIKQNINDIILNIFLEEENKHKVLSKKVNEIISDNNISKMKFIIFENIPKLAEMISVKLQTNKELDDKLRAIVKNIIDENIGSLAGLFINTDKIYDSIKSSIIKNIENTENQNIFGLKIFEYISTYQNKQLSEIYEKFPLELQNIFKEKLSKENVQKMLDETFFEKYFTGELLYNTIEDNVPNFEQKINTSIINLIKDDLKNKILVIFDNIFQNNKEKILSLKINKILNKFDLKSYKQNIFNYIQNFIQKQGDEILSQVHIAEMVENKINSFEIETIENIILSVAKKELNAITMIGGVLGFVIGLIPLLYR